jgi:hypothetical protein
LIGSKRKKHLQFLKIGQYGLILILISIVSCSNRNRSNPLDPKNPDTHGKPTDLRILSDRDNVTLSWDKITLDDITGYKIYKRNQNESNYQIIETIGSNRSTFTEETVPYDQQMTYQITALTSSGYESPFSDSVSITAGPNNYWIVDYYMGSVFHLTYDCLHFFSRFDYLLYPIAITADTTNRSVYFLEEVFGYIWKINKAGEIKLWVSGLNHPSDIAFDNLAQTIWVCNNDGSEIVRFDMDKVKLGTSTGFGKIINLRLSGKDEGCWIMDALYKSVAHLSLYGIEDVKIEYPLTEPSTISCYQSEGWIWIADSLQLIKANANGEIACTIDMNQSITSLSIDQSTGDCWAAIVTDQNAHEILKFSPSGEILVTQVGFAYITAIAANPSNGGCLVADAGTGCINRISNEGKVLKQNCEFYTPWDIVLE